ncbi:MAG: T9SS type A sorting domain-containing protein [Bacteroidetes bacterium]|nr:T9SS type A sorting domain-containing protein [Bacteroidota bacterium]
MKRILLSIAILLCAGLAFSQPNKPIQYVVNFLPDSTGKWDTASRTFYTYLTASTVATNQNLVNKKYKNQDRSFIKKDSAKRIIYNLNQIWDTITLGWVNNLRDSVGYEKDGLPNYYFRESWDTTTKTWVGASGSKIIFDYSNPKGTIKTVTFQKYDAATSTWLNQNQFLFNADTSGKITSGAVNAWSAGAWKLLAKLSNVTGLKGGEFKPTGFTVQVNFGTGFVNFNRVKIKYDWRGNMLDSTVELYDLTSSTWGFSEQNRHRYDTFGNNILFVGEAYFTSQWEIQTGTKDSITYDKDGNYLEEYLFHYNNAFSKWDTSIRKVYFYTPLNAIQPITGGEMAYQIYPNPAKNILTIRNENRTSNAHFTLVNMSGQIILSGKIKGETKANISQLNKGIYLLKIMDERGVKVTKLVKE